MNDPLAQMEASKPVIKDLFRDLLIEMKGFKYQTTLKFYEANKNKKDLQNFQQFILIILQKQ